ncbi:MAG: hypothetical protein DMF03_04550 [Verrucomicrobia bacterium]|nr:MAG: hypothetical protein DMF03_04550 [Verrucomicrobiota bacterium]
MNVQVVHESPQGKAGRNLDGILFGKAETGNRIELRPDTPNEKSAARDRATSVASSESAVSDRDYSLSPRNL